MSLAYLSAAAPDPARVAILAKLSIILGAAEAERTLSNLEKTVAKAASKAAAAAAEPAAVKGAKKVVIPALWAMGGLVAVSFILRLLK